MSNVKNVDFGSDRPLERCLLDAIQDAIYTIGSEKMTPAEILGCLETAKLQFYVDTFLDVGE